MRLARRSAFHHPNGYLFARLPDFRRHHVDAGGPSLPGALLGTGEVLIAGDQYDSLARQSHLFSESSHSWSATANDPSLNRFGAGLTLLPSGLVLYAGGYTGGANGTTYRSAELFDPATSTWSATGLMIALRVGHSMTLLTIGPNAGKVLVAGGGASPNNHASAELYDPATGIWSLAMPMAVRRARHTSTLLKNGDVLVAGGAQSGLSSVTASAEIYHPATDSWRTIAPMSTPRTYQAATLLPNGEVLVAGGYDGSSFLASSEFLQLTRGPNPPALGSGAKPILEAPPVRRPGM